MTPPTDRDQATRDRLAEVLRGHRYDSVGSVCECGAEVGVVCDGITREQHLADVALPVVAKLVREGQAEALETAADRIDGGRRYGTYDRRANISDSLRDRAAALRAPRLDPS